MAAQVRLRLGQFAKFAGLKWPGATSDYKARQIGIDPATYSRIVNGRQAPGERFIAALLAVFQPDGIGFEDLFEVVTDDTPTAVPA